MEPQLKIVFEDPDSGLFEIHKPGSPERGQSLTEQEFRTLQSLMPDTKWILIRWVKPPIPIWHPSHPDYKKTQSNLNLNTNGSLN